MLFLPRGVHLVSPFNCLSFCPIILVALSHVAKRGSFGLTFLLYAVLSDHSGCFITCSMAGFIWSHLSIVCHSVRSFWLLYHMQQSGIHLVSPFYRMSFCPIILVALSHDLSHSLNVFTTVKTNQVILNKLK